MIDLAVLPAYVVSILFVCLTPGPDLAFLISVSIARGPWAGTRAAAGAALGTTAHVLIIAFGLALVTDAHPGWLGAIHLLAAGYLGWLGIGIIRTARTATLVVTTSTRGDNTSPVLWPSFINNLTNISSLLFIAALLPEFVDAERGKIRLQLLALGLIFTISAWIIETGFGLLAAQARTLTTRYVRLLIWVSIGSGVILCALAVLSVIEGLTILRR